MGKYLAARGLLVGQVVQANEKELLPPHVLRQAMANERNEDLRYNDLEGRDWSNIWLSHGLGGLF